MPFAQSDETTGALSTAPRINDVKPAARSEDEKKSACSISEAALESPSQIRGPSTNLRERPF